MAEEPDRLIVEHLDGELLVYDADRDEAHALSGSGAAEFAAAPDDVSRREVLRKMVLAGAAASGGTALVKTIVAPTPAQAESGCAAVCSLANDPCTNPSCSCCCAEPNNVVRRCRSVSDCNSLSGTCS
jgi:hypothetical protein